ncbi:MAG: KH domain-containing protein [Candidatus Saccharimonadales bacterium]|jgi:predicted RNA-binding protein YlqC (UPF0109 family)
MNSIDQQFVEYIVKSLVSKPDAVVVERRIDEKGVLLELTVDPEDLGRVIGKRGATAQSLRTLLRALGTKNDARYNLKIIDNGPMQPRNSYDSNNSYSASTSTPSTPPPADDATNSTTEPAVENNTEDQPTEVKPSEPTETETRIDNEEPTEEVDHEDVVSKTRKELEDLDDLDV